tara:strand:+ start:83294 stop:89974 length:6681 start_codon:yes stop_codon:yes gene_type:complete
VNKGTSIVVILSILLGFQISANEIDWDNFDLINDCPKGICIEPIVNEMETLTNESRAEGCLPDENATEEEVASFFESNDHTIECINKISRLQVLSERIEKIKNLYETLSVHAGNGCFEDSDIIDPEFLALLKGGSTENMCTDEKAAETSAKCGDDVKCALASSATASVGPIIKLLGMSESVNKWLPGEGCDVSDDNCLARAAAGFLKATTTFLTGTWDLLKMGGSWIKDKAISGWEALWGVEDESSTAALAAAEASTDEGVFDMLRNDFTGTISNMWGGLVGMVKEWLKNDVYCEKWSGQPHYSECLEPYPGFDCMSCKAMINGTCNAIGAILAEVVPAFLTGGIVTAAKYGVSGAVKLAKLTKMTDATRVALKASRIDKLAKGTAKVATTIGRGVGKGWGAGINRLQSVTKAAWYQSVKKNLGTIGVLASKGTSLVVGNLWKAVRFGGRNLKRVGKVVIYPIENPLTVKAFQLGMSSVDNLASLGTKSAKVSGGLNLLVKSGPAVKALDEVDQAYAGFQKAKLSVEDSYRVRVQNPSNFNLQEQRRLIDNYEKAQKVYHQKVKANRAEIFSEVIGNSRGEPKLNQIIDELFPELNYDSVFAKTSSRQSISSAERELSVLLGKIENPKVAQQLKMQLLDHKASPARLALKVDGKRFYTKDYILSNAELAPDARFERALAEAEINPAILTSTQRSTLRKSLLEAHEINTTGSGSVFNYSQRDISLKFQTLKKGGYSQEQANRLIRSGLAGDAPISDDIILNLQRVASENAAKSPDEYSNFLKVYKDTIEKAVKKDAELFEEFSAQKFSLARTEDGKEVYILRNSSDPGNWQVYTKNGKRFSIFGKNSYKLRELSSKYGSDLLLDNGSLVKITDGPKGRYYSIEGGLAPSDFKYDEFFNGLRVESEGVIKPRFPKEEFNSFLSKNEKKLEELLKAGKLRPYDLDVKNFVVATDVDSLETFYVFNKSPFSESLIFKRDGGVFKETKKIFSAMEEFAGNSERVLRYSDGSGFKFSLTPRGLYQEALPLISKNSIDEISSTVERVKNGLLKNKGKNHKEYALMVDQHRETLAKLHYRGDSNLQMLGPNSFSTLKGTDGKKYWVLKHKGVEPEKYIVLSEDGSAIGNKGASHISLENFQHRPRDIVNFDDGTSVHFWDSYTGSRAEYIDHVARSSRQNVNDIIRKFDILDNHSQHKNQEFIEFMKKNAEGAEFLIRKRSLSVDSFTPDNFITFEKNGEIFEGLIDVNNKGRIFVLSSSKKGVLSSPRSLQALVPVSDEAITLSNGRVIKVSGEVGQRKVIETLEASTAVKFRQAEQIENSKATLDEKFSLTINKLGLAEKGLGVKTLKSMKTALAKANDVGRTSGNGLFSFADEELALMKKRLVEGGFDQDQADFLVRSGIAARPPTRNFLNASGYFADSFGDITRLNYREKQELLRKHVIDRYSTSDPSGDGFLSQFSDAMGIRSPANRTANSKEAQQVLDNLESLYFIDYKHSSRSLYDVASGKTKLHEVNFSSRYDSGGHQPFLNYKKTTQWLMDENPEMSLETFKKIQAQMMEGGVDGLDSSRIGKIRDVGVIGNVSTPVDRQILKQVDENPYIGFTVTSSTDTTVSGQILYPSFKEIGDVALERLATINPEMVNDIKRLRGLDVERAEIVKYLQTVNANIQKISTRLPVAENKLADLLSMQKSRPLMPSEVEEMLQLQDNIKIWKVDNAVAIEKYNQQKAQIDISLRALDDKHSNLAIALSNRQRELVESLTKERIKWFNQKRAKLGPIDNPEALDEYTDLLAEFQRDIISIHPFADGNGRSTRQFALYYPLMREGFPPPRILNPDNDLFTPLEVWKKEIKDGIIASNELVDDLTLRAQVGLPLDNSPDLIAPMRREPIELDMIRDNKKNPLTPSGNIERIDDGQYAEFVKKVIADDATLSTRMQQNPTLAWEEIHEKALKLHKENNAYYDYRRYKGKERVERLQLGVADQDFRALYGEGSYDDPLKYNYKMNTWYKDEVNWRGLATLAGRTPKSEAELVGMFKQLSPHMTSNHVLGARTADPAKIREVAMGDIDTYKKALFHRGEGDLAEIAKWHSEAVAPHYGQSIGYSTSSDRKVGKAFAMGAMVVADYGKHWDQQHKVAQRVLVGARRSVKDVDLMRLKKLRNDFSYKYYRQKEVMGIGAADPDSIMIIQILDDTGATATTYLRDPENPWRIQIIKGEAEVGESLEFGDERLERIIDLRAEGN